MILFHTLESNFKMKELVSKQTLTDLPSMSNYKIFSKQKIGTDKFLVKFNVCSEEKIGNYLQITTDKEQFIESYYAHKLILAYRFGLKCM